MDLIVKRPEKQKKAVLKKMNDIRRFGTQSMSYSAMQEGMREFRHPSFKGFIAYDRVGGVDFVLSDPVTARKDYPLATGQFLKNRKRVCFCQVSHGYAGILNDMGLAVNGLGVEHIIDLKDFVVSWKVRRGLKRFLSKLTNQGYYVFETAVDAKELQDINSQWLRAKSKKRELRFLARPFTGQGEQDVRLFTMFKGKEMIGFCAFDPVYSGSNDGSISSYCLQHLRVKDQAPQGSQDFLILNSLFQFKDEKISKVTLGLSPLFEMSNSYFTVSKKVQWILNLFSKSNRFYHYKEVGQHKNRFKGNKEQTFVATKSNFGIREIWGLLKVNNLV